MEGRKRLSLSEKSVLPVSRQWYPFCVQSLEMAICTVTMWLLLLLAVDGAVAQQVYSQDFSEDCDNFHPQSSGYACNGAAKACHTFALYRAQRPYMTVASIGNLFDTDPAQIASASNLSAKNFHSLLAKDQQVLIPIACKCAGKFSQANLTYTVQHGDTYLNIANLTLEGLTTCQAMREQNPQHPADSLEDGMKLVAPLRCACPTTQQGARGIKFLLSYIADPDDDDDLIPAKFKITHEDFISANELGEGPNPTIYPYTTLLIPLKNTPTVPPSGPLPPPPPPTLPQSPPLKLNPSHKASSHAYIPVAASVGGAGLLLILVGGIFLAARRRRTSKLGAKLAEPQQPSAAAPSGKLEENEILLQMPDLLPLDRLTHFSFEELQEATDNFSESCRIKGSVFSGNLRGNAVAIKQMKGQVSEEIKMLHKLHHARLVSLVGFCVSDGQHSYLIFEYAENGSLNEWLRGPRSHGSPPLRWDQRMRIAVDIAEGLEYLHHSTTPSCVHKDLKSSNILLDAKFRAKIANFGLARTARGESAVQILTRHIVGTQGYLAPEYLKDGLVTPKLDVFAYGVILLEILSGKGALQHSNLGGGGERLLSDEIRSLLDGENAREKFSDWVDLNFEGDASYSLEEAFGVAGVARECVEINPSRRPITRDVRLCLSKLVHMSISTGDADWMDTNFTNYLEFQGR